MRWTGQAAPEDLEELGWLPGTDCQGGADALGRGMAPGSSEGTRNPPHLCLCSVHPPIRSGPDSVPDTGPPRRGRPGPAWGPLARTGSQTVVTKAGMCTEDRGGRARLLGGGGVRQVKQQSWPLFTERVACAKAQRSCVHPLSTFLRSTSRR